MLEATPRGTSLAPEMRDSPRLGVECDGRLRPQRVPRESLIRIRPPRDPRRHADAQSSTGGGTTPATMPPWKSAPATFTPIGSERDGMSGTREKTLVGRG